MPKAWEPNTFWEYDGQYEQVNTCAVVIVISFIVIVDHNRLLNWRHYIVCLFNRQSCDGKIVGHCIKLLYLWKILWATFSTYSNWKFLTEKTISTQICVLVQTLLENSYLIFRTLYHDSRLFVILIIYIIIYIILSNPKSLSPLYTVYLIKKLTLLPN